MSAPERVVAACVILGILALEIWFFFLAGSSLPHQVEATGATGLEPAASGVTGRRSNQLSYAPEGVRRRSLPAASAQR